VWFGEPLPVDAWSRAEDACAAADLCLVIGTSGLVQPAAGLPALARRAGARIVVVGPEPSALDALADIVLRGRAGDVVPSLVEAPV
jgi:NAD-dependent deacetylase